jgi:tRNA A-37 threonylcarbamoyl transferase component Bud32
VRFLREYCRNESLSQQSVHDFTRKISAAAQSREEVRIKSRSKRCTRDSTTFEIHGDLHEQYYGRRDFGRDACVKVISMHKQAIEKDTARILKTTRNSILTTHQKTNGLPVAVCVKAYLPRGPIYWLKSLVVKTRALKSWIAGNSLLVRGIDTPLPLALLEKTSGPFIKESFLIMQWLEGAVELNDYVTQLHKRNITAHEKDLFVASLAQTIRDLHDKNVYHADLKSTNILVLETGSTAWKFYVVDLDRVLFKQKLTFNERANNLAQINASVSSLMTAKERLKFFAIYAKGTALFKEKKQYYREILKISRGKNTTPFGVVFR